MKNVIVPVREASASFVLSKVDSTHSMEFKSYSRNKVEEDIIILETTGSYSIRCCLMSVFTVAILLCIVSLVVIWATPFSTSISTLAYDVRESNFNTIKNFIIKTTNEVVMISEVNQHLMSNNYNISNTEKIIADTFQIYKALYHYHSDIMVTVYVGDNRGNCLGIMNVEKVPMLFQMWEGTGNPYNETWLTTCSDMYLHNTCVRNNTPDIINPRFNMTPLVEIAKQHPGKPYWIESYIDVTMPNVVFISIISSVIKKGYTEPPFYFGFDISVKSISDFLKTILDKKIQSTAFVLEADTGYIIASSSSSLSFSTVDDKGNIERKTGLTFGDPSITKLTKFILDTFRSLKGIKCDQTVHTEYEQDFVAVYRLCTPQGLNWIVVLSSLKWNYTGSMTIAVIVASVCSVMVIIFGVLASLFLSVRMVSPFAELIKLFDSVGNLEMDKMSIKLSRFSEVSELQLNFVNMIKQLRLYRGFIPAHILSQLENPTTSVPDNELTSHKSLRKKGIRKQSDASVFIPATLGQNKFSLYLEKKHISILGIHIVGFSHWLTTIPHSDIVGVLNDVFTEINKLTKTSMGYLGSLENGTITISWNSAIDQTRYEVKSVSSASTLMKKLNDLKSKWHREELHLIAHTNFLMAVAEQEVLCGNVGTEDLKNFTIFGSSKKNIMSMINLGHKLNIPITITENLAEVCQLNFNSRLIGFVDFAAGSDFLNENKCIYKLIKVFQLGESKNVEMNEWMYELDQKEKLGVWSNYNAGVKAFLESRFVEALVLFENFASANKTEDLPTTQFIIECRKQINKLSY
ncbi:hypothetical protein ABK040_002375 [Willaertia magna]